MLEPSVQSELHGRLLRLRLNRPDRRNALDLNLCQSLADELDRANRNPSVGAILLTGNGRHFCSGMDLDEALRTDSERLASLHERLFSAGSRMNKPLIAGVHGAALAGGCGLVANAHIVIASTDAVFGLSEIRIGLWPFLIFRSVVDAIGDRRALELSVTGRLISAEDALRMGLVHQIAAPGELEGKSLEIAEQTATASAVALASGFAYIRQTRGQSAEAAGAIGRQIRRQVI